MRSVNEPLRAFLLGAALGAAAGVGRGAGDGASRLGAAMSKQMDFDRLSSSAPVNRSSAVVTSRGVHWAPAKPRVGAAPGYIRSDVPLPIQPWPSNMPNVMGTRFGRFTVMGYGGKSASKGRYVVHCTCGAYEHRHMKTLRSDPSRLMCSHCDYLEQMKLGNVELLPLPVPPGKEAS